jgi:hypothetical protein
MEYDSKREKVEGETQRHRMEGKEKETNLVGETCKS